MREEILGPKEYYKIFQSLYVEDSDLNMSSDFEGRATLVKLQKLEKEMLELKRGITTEMRLIRTGYLDDPDLEESKIRNLFNRKPTRAVDKRKKLITERDSRMSPYEEVIKMIDDYIKQIDGLKSFIKEEILETLPKIQ